MSLTRILLFSREKNLTSTKLNWVNSLNSFQRAWESKPCTFCFAQEFLMPCNGMFLSKWRSLTNANAKENKPTEAEWMGWVRNQSLICDLYFPSWIALFVYPLGKLVLPISRIYSNFLPKTFKTKLMTFPNAKWIWSTHSYISRWYYNHTLCVWNGFGIYCECGFFYMLPIFRSIDILVGSSPYSAAKKIQTMDLKEEIKRNIRIQSQIT